MTDPKNLTKGDLTIEEELEISEEDVEESGEYVGTRILYRCEDCEEEVEVTPEEKAPKFCEDCEGEMHLIADIVVDKQEEKAKEEQGETELEELTDKTMDVDLEDDEDENVGNISSLDEFEEPETSGEKDYNEFEDYENYDEFEDEGYVIDSYE